MRPARLLATILVLASAGCVEDRLAVELTTWVRSDGSCSRRIEYTLERVDPDKGSMRLALPPNEDPLRLRHRFPRGGPWQVREEVSSDRHTLLAEASFASPNEIDWDYWRERAPRAPAARNHVSFAATAGELPLFEYAEVFLDPASPLAGARQLGQLLLKKDDEVADRVVRALAELSPRRADVKRSYRETLALPFSQLLDRIAARPLYGPRERQELEALLDRIDAMNADLVKALVASSPSISAQQLEERLKPAMDATFESIEKDLERAGQPLPIDLADPAQRIHFKAVLVLPAAITRANTCVQGDTATWEFDQDDLYGRGFEMWAKAGGR